MSKKALLYGIWLNTFLIGIFFAAIARKMGCDWPFISSLFTS